MRLAAFILVLAGFALGIYQVINAVGRQPRAALTGRVAARHVLFQFVYITLVVYLYLSGE